MASITVTTTATELLPAGANEHSASAPGNVFIMNLGTQTVWFGPTSDVTVATGMPLDPGLREGVYIPAGRNQWGITASGSSAVRVIVI